MERTYYIANWTYIGISLKATAVHCNGLDEDNVQLEYIPKL